MRRAELGEALSVMPRARLEEWAQKLEETGRVATAIAAGSTAKKWLDIPAGPFARGEGEFVKGAGPERAGAP